MALEVVPAQGRSSFVEKALAAQRSFMEVYGDTLEQLLNFVVYMVPIEDNDENETAGFKSQAVFASIDLFNLYRTVLLRSPDALPLVQHGGESDPVLARRRITYTAVAFTLRAVRSLQVLIEMQAQRLWGHQSALKVCFKVEVFKLVLKAILHKCMPFAFYVDEDTLEEVEPPKTGKVAKLQIQAGGNAGPEFSAERYVGARSGRTLPAMGALRELRASDCTQRSLRMQLGELLFHARPLMHLGLLLRRGRKSWAAWSFALVVDYAALNLLAPEIRPRSKSRVASLEIAEAKRRRNALFWALARSPAFDKFMRRPCEILDGLLSRIPIINIFRIMELVLALQPFYFTSSAT
eukprot:CAMPEP_0206459780 /NCGR_PEP_ID=MMETSP0324_2-20121206/24373_1 /ASSEMBLY_ACC=CAM_ASM_000836 /TAXON_ID=2866 /ORGANISM="Crypthecodinium cohnii, Strain Seligo" /LENGTH=350 /DNA_ID=CAMNT_0053931383 /DNA_START=222 /DNA_END=1274 /DNA_ORIENTATION=-